MKARKVPIHIIVMVLLLSVSALTVLAENRVPVEIPLPNAGFEDLEGDPSSALGKIPYMWNLRSAGSNCSAELSDEMAYQGKYSLKLVDNNAKGTVVVASQYIPVEPGEEYVVSAQVFHSEECTEAKDRIDFYITWWTNDYKRITPSVIKRPSKTGEWEEILASGVAPAGAKYLRIWFATVTAGDKCTCYVDDVKLAALREPTPPGVFKGALIFPNPISDGDEARIAYNLPERGQVEVEIFDERGRSVRRLLGEGLEVGYNESIWDGCDSDGRDVLPGIYTCVVSLRENGKIKSISSGSIVKVAK